MVWETRRAGARLAAALAAAALVAAGCGSSGSPAGGESSTLVAYTGQSTDYQINFNPFSPSRIEGIGTIFEPLFFYNIVGKQPPKPRLGKDFAWNADGTQLSVTLRDGVKWSDGQPFTARDVVFTLDLVKKTKSINNTNYQGTATATDDTHVVIAFGQAAFVDGPQVLGGINIVPEHLWKTIADPATEVVRSPVGTGPYLLDEFKAQAFTLKANPKYWGGEPALKKIRYLALSGNQAGVTALKSGQIDWQTGAVPDLKNVAKTYPGYQAIVTPKNQMVLVTCSNSALGCQGQQVDPAVRQAIYHAINRTQLNALAFEDTSTGISPGLALVERDSDVISSKLQNRTAPMQPDVAKAQQILEGAGYRKGADGSYAKGGKPLSLTVKTVAGWTDYITAVNTIGQQLKAAGIKLSAQQLSWNEWSDARDRGQYELIIDSLYQGPAPDPFYVYSYFYSTASTAKVGQKPGANFSRFSDPQVDQAVAALKAINPTDKAARQPYFDVIQTRIEQEMPYIPVLTQGTISVYNAKKFTGWPTSDDLYAFPAVWQAPDNSEIYLRLKPAGQ